MHLWISKLRKRNLQEISNFEYVTNARKIRNWRKEKKLNQRIKIKNYTFTNFEERSVFSPRAEFPFSRLPSRRYPFSPNHVASSDVTARSYGISWNGPTLREYPYTRPARTYLYTCVEDPLHVVRLEPAKNSSSPSLLSLSFSRLVPLLPSPSIRVSLRAAHWSGILKTINGSNPDSLPQSSIVISMHACDCSLIVCNVRCSCLDADSSRLIQSKGRGGGGSLNDD